MRKSKFPKIHIGMRIWKTFIAAFICAIVGMLLDMQPFYSMIAAILCMQVSVSESINKGVTRLVGTLIGGIFAVLILLLIDFTPLEPFSVLYYTIISFCVVPLIYTNVLLKQDASSYITCVVFLSIVLSHLGEGNHYVFALTRMLETAFGIVVAIVINMTIKNNDRKEQSNENL